MTLPFPFMASAGAFFRWLCGIQQKSNYKINQTHARSYEHQKKSSRKGRTHAKNGIPPSKSLRCFFFPDWPFLIRHIVFSKQKWRNSVQDTTKPRGFVEAQEGKYFRVSSPNCTWEWLRKKMRQYLISHYAVEYKKKRSCTLQTLQNSTDNCYIEPFPNCYNLVVLIRRKTKNASWISTSPHLARESLLHHPRRGVHGVPKEAKTR